MSYIYLVPSFESQTHDPRLLLLSFLSSAYPHTYPSCLSLMINRCTRFNEVESRPCGSTASTRAEISHENISPSCSPDAWCARCCLDTPTSSHISSSPQSFGRGCSPWRSLSVVRRRYLLYTRLDSTLLHAPLPPPPPPCPALPCPAPSLRPCVCVRIRRACCLRACAVFMALTCLLCFASAGLALYAFIGMCDPKEVFWIKNVPKPPYDWTVPRCPHQNERSIP